MLPLLSLAYLTTLHIQQPIIAALPRIALLFAALIVGAIYVSIINDITDIKEDAIAGKKNSMANLPIWARVTLVAICLVVGAYFIFALYPDVPSMIFQGLSYLVFTFYSVKPFRFKHHGFLGVLCDASGAHLFPSLLIFTNLMFFFREPIDFILAVSIGIWALMYGLRGILWHQFFDKENDIKSGTRTFAVSTTTSNFKPIETLIITVELLSLAVMVFHVANIFMYLGIFFYGVFIFLRRYFLHYKMIVILAPKNADIQIIMNEYYFVFLPLSLLLSNALSFKYGWVIILIHLMLFPTKVASVVKDCYIILKKSF